MSSKDVTGTENHKKAFLPNINMGLDEEIEESTSSEHEKVLKKGGRKKKRVLKNKENIEPLKTSESDTETDKSKVESVKNHRKISQKAISSPLTNKEIKTVFVNDNSSTEEESTNPPARQKIPPCNPLVESLKTGTPIRRSLSSKYRSQSVLKKRRSSSLESYSTPPKTRKSTQPKKVRGKTYNKVIENISIISICSSPETIDITTPGEVKRKIFLKNADSPKVKKTAIENKTKFTRSLAFSQEDSPMVKKTTIEEKPMLTGSLTFTNEDSPKVKKTAIENKTKFTRSLAFSQEDSPMVKKTTIEEKPILTRSLTFTNEDSPRVKKTAIDNKTKFTRSLAFSQEDSPMVKKATIEEKPMMTRSLAFTNEDSPKVKKAPNKENIRFSTITQEILPKIKEKLLKLPRSLASTQETSLKVNTRRTCNLEKPEEKPGPKKIEEKEDDSTIIKKTQTRRTWNIEKPGTSKIEEKEGYSTIKKKTKTRRTWNLEKPGPGTVEEMEEDSIIVEKTKRRRWNKELAVVLINEAVIETPEKLKSLTVFHEKTPEKSITTTPGKPTKKSAIPTNVEENSRTSVSFTLKNKNVPSSGERKSASFTVLYLEEPRRQSLSFTIASGEIEMEENLSTGQNAEVENLPLAEETRKSSSFTVTKKELENLPGPSRRSSSFTKDDISGDNHNLSLDESIKLFGGRLEKAKSPQKVLEEAGKALNVSKHVTPFLKRLKAKIQTPPSGTSTPNDKKEKIFKKTLEKRLLVNEISVNNVSNNVSSDPNKKIMPTKIPNFALIHKRALSKVEDVKQKQERKKERAQMLLSGYNGTPKAGRTNTNISKTKNNPSIKKPVNIPTRPAQGQKATGKQVTRFGFRTDQNSTKQEQVKAIITKSRPVRNSMEKRRKVFTGVRSNRRFELLMEMRNKKK